MFFNTALVAVFGLGALSMANPTPNGLEGHLPSHVHVARPHNWGSKHGGYGNNDYVVFEVTTAAVATSNVTIALGDHVTLEANATSISIQQIEVERVGRATCTIRTAISEDDVTDTILEGWEIFYSKEIQTFAEVQTISCVYCEGDSHGHKGRQNHEPKYWHGKYKPHGRLSHY